MEFAAGLIALVVCAYLLAGFVKGVIGMGLPTVALGILAAVISPAQAAAILIAPSLATNIWQMVAGPYLLGLIKRLGGMLIGMFLGAWLGNGILTGANAKPAAIGLGIVLVLYSLIGLAKLKFSVPRASEIWLGPLVGVATGVVMAATGVFVIPALPYLQAIGLEKDEMVQALGLHFTVSTGRACACAVGRRCVQPVARHAVAVCDRAGVGRHVCRAARARADQRGHVSGFSVCRAAGAWCAAGGAECVLEAWYP